MRAVTSGHPNEGYAPMPRAEMLHEVSWSEDLVGDVMARGVAFERQPDLRPLRLIMDESSNGGCAA